MISFPSSTHAKLLKISEFHWWFRYRSQLILNSLSSLKFSDCSQINYLEAGCGTGSILNAVQHKFPTWVCLGIEGQSEAVSLANSTYPAVAVRLGDLNDLQLGNRFDCIGCFDVLEHIDHDLSVMKLLRKKLKIGGYLLITVPQHGWLWSCSDEYAGHVRRYSRYELTAKLRTAGFRVHYSISFVSLLLPLMFFHRCLKSNSQEYDFDSEFQINPLLNTAFYALMTFEQFLRKIKIRLPFGGSLLVLASSL